MTTRTDGARAPRAITLHGASRLLEIEFDDGLRGQIPIELMRVYSPSAEVQGHSPEQAVLQTGKREVTIVAIEPVGHYGMKPRFSDGHDSGIFTWVYLRRLVDEREALWADYERRLAAAGRSRDDPMPFIK